MAAAARSLQVAIPIFNHMTALDAVGPFEILNAIPGASVVFVGDKPGRITTKGKLGLFATASFDVVPKPHLIVVPGGPPAGLPLQHKPLLHWIRKVHETTIYTTSVCTGSLLLGAAGILNGIEATTHWACYKELAQYGAKPTSKRYVHQGKIITAAGVSSGIDMALYLASILCDEQTARAIQLLVEYDPQPPFDAGSVEKAGPEGVDKAYQLRKQRLETEANNEQST